MHSNMTKHSDTKVKLDIFIFHTLAWPARVYVFSRRFHTKKNAVIDIYIIFSGR